MEFSLNRLKEKLGIDLPLASRAEPPPRLAKCDYKSREDGLAAYRKFRDWGDARNALLAENNLTRAEAVEFNAILRREVAGWKRLADSWPA